MAGKACLNYNIEKRVKVRCSFYNLPLLESSLSVSPTRLSSAPSSTEDVESTFLVFSRPRNSLLYSIHSKKCIGVDNSLLPHQLGEKIPY